MLKPTPTPAHRPAPGPATRPGRSAAAAGLGGSRPVGAAGGRVRGRLGVGLLLGRYLPVVLAGVALQLAATFLVLLLRPDVAFVAATPCCCAWRASTW
jgi:hypothetical protein